LYAAASYATPAQGAPLDLPFKKRVRDAEPPEHQEPLKTKSYLLLLTTEQKKGKFEFKIISSLSRLSLLLNALTHEMFIHSSHLFTSHLFSSPLPFFTNDSFTALQRMLYLRRFLYNLIVRAYNNGEVTLHDIQEEFSTSTSPIFLTHPELNDLPSNMRQGVCHDFVKNVKTNQRKQAADPNFRFEMKELKANSNQSLVVDKSKTPKISPTLNLVYLHTHSPTNKSS
jgi:hypothetical protein